MHFLVSQPKPREARGFPSPHRFPATSGRRLQGRQPPCIFCHSVGVQALQPLHQHTIRSHPLSRPGSELPISRAKAPRLVFRLLGRRLPDVPPQQQPSGAVSFRAFLHGRVRTISVRFQSRDGLSFLGFHSSPRSASHRFGPSLVAGAGPTPKSASRLLDSIESCPTEALLRAAHPPSPNPLVRFTTCQSVSCRPGLSDGHEIGRAHV